MFVRIRAHALPQTPDVRLQRALFSVAIPRKLFDCSPLG